MKKTVLKMVAIPVVEDVFQFDELPTEGKAFAIKERRAADEAWFWEFSEDQKDAFFKMADVLGFQITDYEYSLCSYSYTKLDVRDEELYAMGTRRTMAYVYNNWIKPYLTAPTKLQRKMQYGGLSLGEMWNCPFSGMGYDYVLIEAFEDFVETAKIGKRLYGRELNFGDFMRILGEHMTREVISEAEYRDSDEGIGEELAASGLLFFADGTVADVVDGDAA